MKMKLFVIIVLLSVSGCKEITQVVWDSLIKEKGKSSSQKYGKSIQVSATLDDATGDAELSTLYAATGANSIVYCDDGDNYDLLFTVDETTRIITFQRFYMTYDEQVCELYLNIEGAWDELGEERFFCKTLEFDEKEFENIFIRFKEIVIK